MAGLFASQYLSALNGGNTALSRKNLLSKTDRSQHLELPVLSLHCWPELQNMDCEQLPKEPLIDGEEGGGHRTKWQTLSLPLLRDQSFSHCSLLMPES